MWWIYLVVAAIVVFATYAFITLAGFEKRVLTRRTDRRAEDLYDNYRDSGSAPRDGTERDDRPD
jgi:hypothetical protein